MNKHLLIGAFLVSGACVNAKLQEKLSVNNVKINVIKQNIKTGNTVIAKDHCKFCNKDCKKA